MAERFAFVSEEELKVSIKNKDSKNTKRTTKTSVKILNIYLREKNLEEPQDKTTLANVTGAPNDGFLPNALKRCFRLSGVLLKLCRLILGCAIKCLSIRFF